MEIIHRLKAKDYIQFNLFQIEHSGSLRKKLKWQRLIATVLFVALAVFAYIFLTRFSLVVAGIFLLIGAFWYIYFPTFSKKQVVKSTEKAIARGHLSTLFDEVRLKMDASGIEEITSQGSHMVLWPEIEAIDFTPDAIYFFTAQASAIIIPQTSLAPGEYDELKELIDQHYQGSLSLHKE